MSSKQPLSNLEEKLVAAMGLLEVVANPDTVEELTNYILLQQQKYKTIHGDYFTVKFVKTITFHDYIP